MYYPHKATSRLEVRIKINGKSTYIGLANTSEEAEAMIAGAKKVLNIFSE